MKGGAPVGRKISALLLALGLLAGCAPLLERTYSTAEPHSSKFWESEAAGTLRAETHQDVVNDLLLLIGQHRETATLRLYNFDSDLTVADTLEQATTEIQQETPMGAYAVEYITASSHAQRGYYEVAVRISYRRTLEQLQAVVNATSPEAVYSLLADALDAGKTELAVRMGYWGEDGQARVADAMAQLREERDLTESPAWVVNCYPSGENPGLVEFLLDPPELPEIIEGNEESGGIVAENSTKATPEGEAAVQTEGNASEDGAFGGEAVLQNPAVPEQLPEKPIGAPEESPGESDQPPQEEQSENFFEKEP